MIISRRYGKAGELAHVVCRILQKPGSSSAYSNHRAHDSRSSNPVAATPHAPPPRSRRTPARRRRASTRRRARCRSVRTSRRLAHTRNTAAILLRNNVDLARGVTAHKKAPLAVPCETYRAETGARASGQIGIGYDVGGCGGAVCGHGGRAVGVKVDQAELVANGLFAVPVNGVKRRGSM
jgi:hypothetical protein